MKISFKKTFIRRYSQYPLNIREKVDEKIRMFQKDPFAPNLRNHALRGEYRGLRSIDVTGDIRAIFYGWPNEGYEFVEFVDMWTHSQLYG